MDALAFDAHRSSQFELARWHLAQRRYLDYYCDTPWAKWLVEVLPETFVPRSGEFVAFADYHREFWEWVWEIEPGQGIEALLTPWPRDSGKALALDTPLVTPSGWTTMGRVAKGDVVFAHDGSPTKVLAISEIDVRPCYLVSFDDGTSIVASDEHLWAVLGRTTRRVGSDWPRQAKPLTTRALAAIGPVHGEAHRWAIPVTKPLHRLRYITSIEPVEPTAVRCITVDHPDSLYLAGEGMIPTHNSRNTEAACVYLTGEKKRRYVLYCSETQPRADQHLDAIEGLLSRPTVQARYPDLCEKSMGKFGVAKEWNVTLIRTKLGASFASAGLDKAVRGSRLDDQRFDFIALDDVDSDRDSAHAVAKKETTISRAIIPAGDRGKTAIVFPQNLVHSNSVMCHILDGKADFLRDRRVSGPHPAVLGLEYTEEIVNGKRLCRITKGTPTWDGMSLEDCEKMMNDEGPAAFLAERQHIREAKQGALWTRDIIHDNRRDRPVHLVQITVNVDPETSADPTGSKTGITVTARAVDGHGYLLANHTNHYKGTTKGPGGGQVDAGWGQKAVDLVSEWDADCVVAETNQGGDMVRSIIHLINPNIAVVEVRAKHGKHLRAEPVAQLYWRGLIHHVGVFQDLEDQMCEVYDPYHPSITWDDMDSMVYGFRYLLLPGSGHNVLRALDPNRHRTPRPGPTQRPPVSLG